MLARNRFPLTAALLRAFEEPCNTPRAVHVDQLDRARRPRWPYDAPPDAQGIPSIFWGFRTHTGQWVP